MKQTRHALDLPALDSNTLAARAYQALLEAILTGKIKPGEHLVEMTLADRLRVSRFSVRDAFRELARDGLIAIIPNRGAFVINLTPDDIAEIFELRAALECMCIELATQRATPEDFTHLQEIVRQMDTIERRNNRVTGAQVDTQFHRVLMNISRHQRAIQVWERMSAQITVIVYSVSSIYPLFGGFAARHAGLISLMQKCDAPAASAYLQNHIREGAEKLISAHQQLNQENQTATVLQAH
jgi:DNA-binding GntR family transcriptional regulator